MESSFVATLGFGAESRWDSRNVSPKGQVELPKDFCERKRIKPATALRVTEVEDGLYVTPLPEPTEKRVAERISGVNPILTGWLALGMM
jgi:hypothetical protein